MRHHEVYIDVWNCAARVARYVQTNPHTFTREFATNSEALADRAEAEVYSQGGGVNISGHYNPSEELVALAEWHNDT